MNLDIYLLLNSLKEGYKHKKMNIVIPYDKASLNLIKLLVKYGYIEKYLVLNSLQKHINKINIDLSYNMFEPAIKNIKILCLPNKHFVVSYKQLDKLTASRNSMIILSTSKGFITHQEALNLNIGGVLICVIDNQ